MGEQEDGVSNSQHAARSPGIGERIRRLRVHVLQIPSQIDFADRLGVSRGAVGNWETGKDISRASVQKIVETFDVSYDWLASGRGQPLNPRPLERHIHDLLADYEGEADDFISLVELLLQERLKQLRDRKRQK